MTCPRSFFKSLSSPVDQTKALDLFLDFPKYPLIKAHDTKEIERSREKYGHGNEI
jgi:hypothetical protein